MAVALSLVGKSETPARSPVDDVIDKLIMDGTQNVKSIIVFVKYNNGVTSSFHGCTSVEEFVTLLETGSDIVLHPKTT